MVCVHCAQGSHYKRKCRFQCFAFVPIWLHRVCARERRTEVLNGRHRVIYRGTALQALYGSAGRLNECLVDTCSSGATLGN